MYCFKEAALVTELAALPGRARAAFAVATATRQLGSYERFARVACPSTAQRPRELAVELWSALQADSIDRELWLEKLDEVMGLLPEEGDDWTISHALADDALSSLAYAIRCMLSAEPQEAAWAARRAYEAADQAAIRTLGVQPGHQDTEATIESHFVVQRELARQQQNLLQLQGGSLDEIQRQVFRDELLTADEAVSVV